MIKLLHSPILLVFLLITSLGYSQSQCTHDHFSEAHTVTLIHNNHSFLLDESDLLIDEDFSYIFNLNETKYKYLYQNMDHDNEQVLSLIDIISSDEGTDFNCSGGFCMNKLHYHKKGLTLKRQFFGYFMSINC